MLAAAPAGGCQRPALACSGISCLPSVPATCPSAHAGRRLAGCSPCPTLPPVPSPYRICTATRYCPVPRVPQVYSLHWNQVRRDCFLSGSWDDTVKLWNLQVGWWVHPGALQGCGTCQGGHCSRAGQARQGCGVAPTLAQRGHPDLAEPAVRRPRLRPAPVPPPFWLRHKMHGMSWHLERRRRRRRPTIDASQPWPPAGPHLPAHLCRAHVLRVCGAVEPAAGRRLPVGLGGLHGQGGRVCVCVW